jgi:hypothetical protein
MQDYGVYVCFGFFSYIPSVVASNSFFWLFGSLRVQWQRWDFLVPIIPGICWITACFLVEEFKIPGSTFGDILVQGVILGIFTAAIPLWRILHAGGPDAAKGVALITAFLILAGVALAFLCPPIMGGF